MLLDALTVASKELPRALQMIEDGISRTSETTAPPGSSDRAGRGEDVTAFLRSLPTAASPVLLLVSYHEDLVGLGRLEPHWVYDTSMMSCRSARWRRVANTKQAAHVAAARSTSTDNVAREDIIDASLAALCEQLEIRSSRTNHLAQTASHLQTSSPLEK